MISGDDILVRLIGDGSSYQNMLNRARVSLRAFSGDLTRASIGVTQQFGGGLANVSNTLMAFGVTLGAVGFASFIRGSLAAAASMEATQVQLEVLLGSAERGERAMTDLWRLAVETPLTFPDVTHAARTVVQYDAAGQDLAGTLRMLGDVTGGDAMRFQRMALAFGQVHAAGRLMGQEVLQMVNAGFNPLTEISRVTGRSMRQLRDDMRAGRISVEMVREAFESATGPGGRFHNMLGRIGQTTSGLFSIMKDEIFGAMREVGDFIIKGFSLKEIMLGISAGAGAVVTWFREMSPETREMIGNIGKAALAMTAGRFAVVALGGALVGLWGVIAAHPLGAFLTVVGVAVGALAQMRTEADRLMTLQTQGGMPGTISAVQAELDRVIQAQAAAQNMSQINMGTSGFSLGILMNAFRPILGTANPLGVMVQDSQLMLQAQQSMLQNRLIELRQERHLQRLLARRERTRQEETSAPKGTLKDELAIREKITDEVERLTFLLRDSAEAQFRIYDYTERLAAFTPADVGTATVFPSVDPGRIMPPKIKPELAPAPAPAPAPAQPGQSSFQTPQFQQLPGESFWQAFQRYLRQLAEQPIIEVVEPAP